MDAEGLNLLQTEILKHRVRSVCNRLCADMLEAMAGIDLAGCDCCGPEEQFVLDEGLAAIAGI